MNVAEQVSIFADQIYDYKRPKWRHVMGERDWESVNMRLSKQVRWSTFVSLSGNGSVIQKHISTTFPYLLEGRKFVTLAKNWQ